MFSTLSNLLPSSLQPTGAPESTADPNSYDTEPDDDGKSIADNDGSGLAGKKKKGKGPNETFIIVRPPPSKSNHPLNLQVQLVPPHGTRSTSIAAATGEAPNSTTSSHFSEGSGDSRRSVDMSENEADGRGLSRSSSIRSERSVASYLPTPNPPFASGQIANTSTTSFSSVASTSTTASNISARRTIVPLYNLQAHNVMTNVVVDAGTDAKIAKYQRRTLEMIDLCLLESIEVWPGSGSGPGGQVPPSARGSLDIANRNTSLRPDAGTPGSSAVSLSSAGHSVDVYGSQAGHVSEPPEINITPIPEAASPTTPGASGQKKNIFGKIFSRKDKNDKRDGSPTPSPSPSHLRTGSGAGGESFLKRHSKNLSASFNLTPGREPTSPSKGEFGETRRSMSPARPGSASSSARNSLALNDPAATGAYAPYTNTVLPDSAATAKDAAALLRPPVLGLQSTISGVPPTKGRVSLYVWAARKWMKGQDTGFLGLNISGLGSAFGEKGGGGSGQNAHSGSGGVEVRFEWKRSAKVKKSKRKGAKDDAGGETTEGEMTAEKRKKKRRASVSSVDIDVNALEGEGGTAVDDGEDSDPEDSETPWVCTLKIRKQQQSLTSGAGLSPTPSRLSANPPSLGKQSSAARLSNQSSYGELGEQQIRERTGSTISNAVAGAAAAKAEKEGKTLRIKVGTLSPTPHHPKVVGMLKVPYPLVDVDFGASLPGGVQMRKRAPGQQPPSPDAGEKEREKGAFTLTAEEIKDVICCTGLWLVVRESFGGVGRDRRKGDGWRIRG